MLLSAVTAAVVIAVVRCCFVVVVRFCFDPSMISSNAAVIDEIVSCRCHPMLVNCLFCRRQSWLLSYCCVSEKKVIAVIVCYCFVVDRCFEPLSSMKSSAVAVIDVGELFVSAAELAADD